MPDFTNGKWIYLASAMQIFTPATKADDDPFGLTITDIPFANDIPEKEKHANGRLIATAPEMYEALKECADFMEDIICRNCTFIRQHAYELVERDKMKSLIAHFFHLCVLFPPRIVAYN